jgi:hypothetical protein
MPKGSGIYEDEPREHRTTYSQDSGDDDPQKTSAESAPDDTSSDDAGEPTG